MTDRASSTFVDWPDQAVATQQRWAVVEGLLRPNERVRWWDWPMTPWRRPSLLLEYGLYWFYLVSTPFLAALLFQLPRGEGGGLILGFFGVALLVNWVVCLIGVVAFGRLVTRTKRTVYVVTDTRVIVAEQNRVHWNYLRWVSPLVGLGTDGRGDLVFDPGSVRRRIGLNSGRRVGGFAFEDIAHVEPVASLIAGLAANDVSEPPAVPPPQG